MTSDDQHSVEGWRCEHRSTASPAQRQLVLKLPDAGGSVRTEGLQLVFVCHRHATVGMRIPSISKLRWGGSLLFAPKGSFRWSTAFSMGPLPVTQAWVQKPRFASIAVLAFLTCVRRPYSSAMAVPLHHLRCAPFQPRSGKLQPALLRALLSALKAQQIKALQAEWLWKQHWKLHVFDLLSCS